MEAKVKKAFIDKADNGKLYKVGDTWKGTKGRFEEIGAKGAFLAEIQEAKAAKNEAKAEAKAAKAETKAVVKEMKTNTETKELKPGTETK